VREQVSPKLEDLGHRKDMCEKGHHPLDKVEVMLKADLFELHEQRWVIEADQSCHEEGRVFEV